MTLSRESAEVLEILTTETGTEPVLTVRELVQYKMAKGIIEALRIIHKRRNRAITSGVAAKMLKVAPRTIAKYCDSGILPCYRLPKLPDDKKSKDDKGDRRIKLGDFFDFLVNHEIPIPASLDVLESPVIQTMIPFQKIEGALNLSLLQLGSYVTTNVTGKTIQASAIIMGTEYGTEVALKTAREIKELDNKVPLALLIGGEYEKEYYVKEYVRDDSSLFQFIVNEYEVDQVNQIVKEIAAREKISTSVKRGNK